MEISRGRSSLVFTRRNSVKLEDLPWENTKCSEVGHLSEHTPEAAPAEEIRIRSLR
jgi:hypothetical protein